MALLVTQRYSAALHKAMVGQAENLAHAMALDAADKILSHDLVALQKMLDQQVRSNSLVGYVFVLEDGRILALKTGCLPVSSAPTRLRGIGLISGK